MISRKSNDKLVRELVNTMLSSAAVSVVLAVAAPTSAFSQATAAVQDGVEEEIIVTGSRIVREGYEAPTPLTVIGAEALEQAADVNLINALSTMPAVTGANTATASSTQLGQGGAGLQAMNLRSLGPNRVLVLLDGQRAAPSTYGNFVDLSAFPTQLISRVDIVTGGASAVYGSDAVAGVVNFILDREFVGVRAEVSAGLTSYGDDRNYKVEISGGFPFAGGRGHVLMSGQHLYNGGIDGDGGREWNRTGHNQFANPAYTATNGQPQNIFLPGGSSATMAPGGIIVAGPLKGTAFGQGGTPYQFQYGSVISGSMMVGGGDWLLNDIRRYNDLDPKQKNENFFLRVSYDLADNVTVFGQYLWAQPFTQATPFPVWLPGTATGYVIQIDNAFLPAATRAAMVANNITSFGIGSWNEDMPEIDSTSFRLTNRITGGLEGTFDALGSEWSWNAAYAYSATKIKLRNNVPVVARLRLAFDAVVNPANGQIVCRSVLQGANNGCKPWNAMGVGVNEGNDSAYSWIIGGDYGYETGTVEQTTIAGSLTGEPFSLWAGPVSVAAGFEHRIDEIQAVVDPFSLGGQRFAGNFAPLSGKQSVTEGAVEAIVPLAQNESFAQSWDLSLAARFTDYELSGFVTTWKVGTTYSPIDDIRLRVTRSRDIRAPNLQELFQPPSFGNIGASVIDRFLNQNTPASTLNGVSGNVNLLPEKADTTGIGVVLAPSFLDGFTASVDYWDVKIKGAIQPITAQQVMDSCFNKTRQELCTNIVRNPDGTVQSIATFQINLAVQDVKGIDFESSYRMPLSNINSEWEGEFRLHGLVTHYMRNYRDTTFVAPTDTVGQNGGDGTPNWKYSVTATYALDPISVAVTGRGFSDGTINSTYIECTSGCPAATVANPTINSNSAPGRFYLDANITYGIDIGETASADVFFSARNLLNADVPPLPSVFFYSMGLSASSYDAFGTVYRAGIRFSM